VAHVTDGLEPSGTNLHRRISMNTLGGFSEEDVVEAVALWTGWGSEPWPRRSDQKLIERFGAAAGDLLITVVRKLEQIYYLSDAHESAPDLRAMAQRASDDFARNCPGIPSAIADAFAWCYTFDYK
jgi:hypothetical protein